MIDAATAPAGPAGFRCGLVGLIGKPNAGKSTLVNAVLGSRLAIVSPKPQTTRDKFLGIHSTDAAQIVFVDMPGLIVPRDKFNEALMEVARTASEGLDAALHLVDARDPEPFPEHITNRLQTMRCPVFLVWTHCDELKGHATIPGPPPEHAARYNGIFAVSGTMGFGLHELIEAAIKAMPEGPPLYPVDDLTDRDLRYLAAEKVRERVFNHLDEEVPYGVFCFTEDYKERSGDAPDFIRVTIYVERESHKRILIGAGGRLVKQIGQEARTAIEEIVGKRVFLDLWVKIKPQWRQSERDLMAFGFPKTGKRDTK